MSTDFDMIYEFYLSSSSSISNWKIRASRTDPPPWRLYPRYTCDNFPRNVPSIAQIAHAAAGERRRPHEILLPLIVLDTPWHRPAAAHESAMLQCSPCSDNAEQLTLQTPSLHGDNIRVSVRKSLHSSYRLFMSFVTLSITKYYHYDHPFADFSGWKLPFSCRAMRR